VKRKSLQKKRKRKFLLQAAKAMNQEEADESNQRKQLKRSRKTPPTNPILLNSRSVMEGLATVVHRSFEAVNDLDLRNNFNSSKGKNDGLRCG
jgi:hypothetical protein